MLRLVGGIADDGRTMGDIVQFRATRKCASAPDAAATGESAEIMFFTGVRYERREDEASAQSETYWCTPSGALATSSV